MTAREACLGGTTSPLFLCFHRLILGLPALQGIGIAELEWSAPGSLKDGKVVSSEIRERDPERSAPIRLRKLDSGSNRNGSERSRMELQVITCAK